MKVFLKAVAALVVLLAAFVGYTVFTRPSDEEQIVAALDAAIANSEDGKPGGVFDYLGKDFKVNEFAVTPNADVMQFIRNSKRTLAVEDKAVEVRGEEGLIVSPVTVEVSLMGQREFRIDEARFFFAREEDRLYGLIPVRNWKLSRIELPGVNPLDAFGVPGF